MSNMKNANRITVAYGDVPREVLEFTVSDFGRLALDVEEIEDMATVTVVTGGKAYYIAGEHDDLVGLSTIIECLDDHINNVPEEQLGMELEEVGYHCCNKSHLASPKLACMDGLPDCIHCNVYRYTYYGPDCIAEVYYVKTT